MALWQRSVEVKRPCVSRTRISSYLSRSIAREEGSVHRLLITYGAFGGSQVCRLCHRGGVRNTDHQEIEATMLSRTTPGPSLLTVLAKREDAEKWPRVLRSKMFMLFGAAPRYGTVERKTAKHGARIRL